MSLQRESQAPVASASVFQTGNTADLCPHQLFHAVTFIDPADDNNINMDTQEK